VSIIGDFPYLYVPPIALQKQGMSPARQAAAAEAKASSVVHASNTPAFIITRINY
jgi:hypothetical protein